MGDPGGDHGVRVIGNCLGRVCVELARVDAKWLVRLPQGMTLETMRWRLGRQGFTAMQCVIELECGMGWFPGEGGKY